MQLWIAIVQTDQNFVGKLALHRNDLRLYAVLGCEVTFFAGCQIDGMNVPVLIPTLVLDVQDVLVVFSPEIRPNSAVTVLGHRAVVFFTDRAYPDVKYAFVRRDIGQALAVGGNLRTGLVRIAENDISRNQRGQLGRRKACHQEKSAKRRNHQHFHRSLLKLYWKQHDKHLLKRLIRRTGDMPVTGDSHASPYVD